MTSGTRVYFLKDHNFIIASEIRTSVDTHTAILMDIAPICEHPKNKVRLRHEIVLPNAPGQPSSPQKNHWFECECGAKVHPEVYKEIEE